MADPREPWPIPIAAVGACAAGTVAFRLAGRLHVTAVIKATFAFVPNAPMARAAPEPLIRTERHHGDQPTRSVRLTSDLAAYLHRVDVVVTGHACAPRGTRVESLGVRLAIQGEATLLDKSLHVYGDRRGHEIVPFERMPIVYERALGGIGFRANPHGTGIPPSATSPNVLDPGDPHAVASFAPLSRALPVRKARLGGLSPKVLRQRVPDLPAEFDWDYFQSAPADQQIPSLEGNEWIVLEGLSADHPHIASRLPAALAFVAVYGLDPGRPGEVQVLAARPDLLRIDADALTCSLAFRVVIPVDDERAIETLRLAGEVESEGEPLTDPSTAPLPLGAAMPKDEETADESDFAATVAIEGKAKRARQQTLHFEGPLPHTRTLPFAAGAAGTASPARPIAGAPWSGIRALAPPTVGRPLDLTIDLAEPEQTPPPPPAPSSPAPALAQPWKWAEAPPAPPIEAPRPAPRPQIPHKPAVNKSLYGTFGPPRSKKP